MDEESRRGLRGPALGSGRTTASRYAVSGCLVGRPGLVVSAAVPCPGSVSQAVIQAVLPQGGHGWWSPQDPSDFPRNGLRILERLAPANDEESPEPLELVGRLQFSEGHDGRVADQGPGSVELRRPNQQSNDGPLVVPSWDPILSAPGPGLWDAPEFPEQAPEGHDSSVESLPESGQGQFVGPAAGVVRVGPEPCHGHDALPVGCEVSFRGVGQPLVTIEVRAWLWGYVPRRQTCRRARREAFGSALLGLSESSGFARSVFVVL